MTDEPDRNNPLSPYWPSEAPAVPGSGRSWFAILLALILFVVPAVWVLYSLVRSLF